MSYAKFDYTDTSIITKCPKCDKSTRFGLGFSTQKASCIFCSEIFCDLCISEHKLICEKRHSENCCGCGCKRDSIYASETKCKTCDEVLCIFCNVNKSRPIGCLHQTPHNFGFRQSIKPSPSENPPSPSPSENQSKPSENPPSPSPKPSENPPSPSPKPSENHLRLQRIHLNLRRIHLNLRRIRLPGQEDCYLIFIRWKFKQK